MIVADRLGKYDACGLGSMGDSRGDSPGVVMGDPKLRWENDMSESSGDCRDEVEDEEAEFRSGALYASMLVVESNSTGPEIFPRLMVPEENLTWPSR